MASAKKKLGLNTVTSVILQITSVICGFVFPRLIIGKYGSAVNGLVSSVTQFLSLITLLELGVGAVIQSALYKPLAEKDDQTISAIMSSGTKFFKRIAGVLFVYVLVLIFIYPVFINREFNWFYTAFLIAAISISSFAQYYFGMMDQLLLSADQRGYVQYLTRIIVMVLNMIFSAILIASGASIQIVQLTTSLVYLIRPIIMRRVVNKYYRVDRHYQYEIEPIKQKWNGIAQHISMAVLGDTDTIVLTLFSTLSNVSIYAVYNLILTGIKNLLLSATNGIKALIGELWAKQELEKLREFFGMVEFGIHAAVVYIFTCTAILIVPFVQVYTKGITDANYVQPLFAVLITAAHAGHCLRLPYNIMILAAGHYKETQSNYIIAAVMNVVISVVAVWRFGLAGVAFGTLAAMLYQTVWMAYYNSKNLIQWPIEKFVKQMLFDVITVGLIVLSTWWIKMASITYISWTIMACEVAVIALVVVIIMSMVFYHGEVRNILSVLKRKTGE